MLESPKGIVVGLANWSGKPIANLGLEINGVKEAQTFESAAWGKLRFRLEREKIILNLPVDTSDLLMIR